MRGTQCIATIWRPALHKYIAQVGISQQSWATLNAIWLVDDPDGRDFA